MILILLFAILLVTLYIQTNGSLGPALLASVGTIYAYFGIGLQNIDADIKEIEQDIEKEIDGGDIGGDVQEVFHIPNQMFTYAEAKAFCKAIGVRLATLNEVKTAYLEGAQWYNMGWTDGQLGLYVLQPRFVRRNPFAGNIGVNGGYFHNARLRMGINCYGVKPKPDPARIEYSYDELQKELDEEGGEGPGSSGYLEKKYKDMLNQGDILISPWNDKKWSIDSERQSKYHLFPESREPDPDMPPRVPDWPIDPHRPHRRPHHPPKRPGQEPEEKKSEDKGDVNADTNVNYSKAVASISKGFLSNSS